MTKSTYKSSLVPLVLSAFLLCSFDGVAATKEAADDIEVVRSDISFTLNEFPRAAFLNVGLKNNSPKEIKNANLEIIYYDADGNVVKKIVLRNRLTSSIPAGQTKEYKIRLKGDFVNERNEEYPYTERDSVEEFEVRVAHGGFGWW